MLTKTKSTLKRLDVWLKSKCRTPGLILFAIYLVISFPTMLFMVMRIANTATSIEELAHVLLVVFFWFGLTAFLMSITSSWDFRR